MAGLDFVRTRCRFSHGVVRVNSELIALSAPLSKKCLIDTLWGARAYKKFAWSHAKIRFVFDEMQSSRFFESIVGRAKWLGLGLPSDVIVSIVPALSISTVPLLVILPLANNKFYIFVATSFSNATCRAIRRIDISRAEGRGVEWVIRDANV